MQVLLAFCFEVRAACAALIIITEENLLQIYAVVMLTLLYWALVVDAVGPAMLQGVRTPPDREARSRLS